MATLTTSYQLIVNKYIGNIYQSGTVSSKDLYLRIYAKYNSQNVANNQSSVSYKSTLYITGSGYFYTYNTTTKSLSGTGATSTSASAQGTYYGGQETTLSEISGTVTHNASGAASVSMSASWVSTPWDISGSASGTASLPTIPRASQPSIITYPNTTQNIGNIGSTVYIHMNRASSAFTHTVRYAFGSLSGTIATGVTNNCTWTIPTSFYAQIPTATSGVGTVYCDTYNGSTFIGTKSVSFTTTVANSIVPTVGTITITPQTYSYLIQNKNTVKVTVSGCSAGAGSSIKSYTFSGPGISTTTTSTSATSSTMSSSGTKTYTVTVTDNRGRTASKTASITCYAWSAPSISLNAYRVASQTGTTEDDSGKYVRCTYNLSYSSVNNTNDVIVKIYYKKNTASSWASATVLTDSKNTSGNYTLSNIDIASTYTMYATVTDNYSGSSDSNKITIFSAERILNIRPKGAGIAFGKMADIDNTLDSKWPIRSDNPERTMQNLSYRGIDLISSVTDDTTTNWGKQGNLAMTLYTKTGQIIDQPSQYGFVLNLTPGPNSSEVHQIWTTQASGNLLHRGGNHDGWLGTWRTILDSSNYTSWVSAKPTTLYSTSTGNIGTVTLSESAANFTYLEIFYTDNNNRQPNSVRIYSPNGKYVTLSCVEPSTSGSDPRVYIRTSGWTISGTSMTVGRSDLSGTNRGVYGQIYPHANGTNIDVKVTANNYIKIFRVLGYK